MRWTRSYERAARACVGTMTLFSSKLKQAARTAKFVRSQRLVAGNGGGRRHGYGPINAVVAIRARAYAAIDVIQWPGGFSRRDTGGRALARDPIQSNRITPGSMRF